MEPIMVTVPPNTPYEERYSHPGEEFYFVVEGVLVFRIEGKEYLLNAGDSIHFPSEKLHEWKNPTNDEAVLISVLTPVIF
ncbi:cupin domain-containing protein [Virgibacillus halophilus]|nr:cupin domain-containing protein [Virgibacillus halophilus]